MQVIMKQTKHSFNLMNQFLKVASGWFAASRRNYTVAQEEYLIVDGLVWTRQRSRLLRLSVDAAKQGWCYKANSYIGKLALDFGLNTYNLTLPLCEAMVNFGYSDQEIKLLSNWINGYRTGINNFIQTNKYTS